jgi:crossover junction endodeoxyribonuclease RuvC
VRVLGVDPGSRVLGWGVIQRAGTRLEHVAHGTIIAQGDSFAARLAVIDDRLAEVIATHQPTTAAVETIFYSKNAQSAAKLGHARGVVLLRLVRQGILIHEYSPARVKRAVAGGGRADKRQVAMVVKALLRLPEVPPSDAADALAMALTHLYVSRFEQALERR